MNAAKEKKDHKGQEKQAPQMDHCVRWMIW